MSTAKAHKKTEPGRTSEGGRLPDIVVYAGGAAFALAAAFGLYVQGGLPVAHAVVAALVIFVMIAALQVALRRTQDVAILKERLGQLEMQLGRGAPESRTAAESLRFASDGMQSGSGDGPAQMLPHAGMAAGPTDPMQVPVDLDGGRSTFGLSSQVKAPRQRVVSGWSSPRQPALSPAAMQPERPQFAPPAATRRDPTPKPMPEAGANLPPPVPPGVAPQATMAPARDHAPAPPIAHNPVESMVEEIAGGLGAYRPGALDAAPMSPPVTAAGAMDRVAAAPQSLTSRVLDAIEAGRVEILLQPIVGLEDRSVVSYEAFPRLKDEAGEEISPAEYTAPAKAQGVLAEIEKIAVFRSIQLLERLEERQRLSPIFINISRQTLVDGGFYREIGAVMKEYKHLASALVFELTQKEARSFGEEEFENLEGLGRMGLSFAIDELTDLEMDFVPLIERQFAFVKLKAAQLLTGLSSGGTVVPTNDIPPMFEEAGLQLMIESIEDEAMLAQVEASGIKYGQGSVFAAPSPVKAEIMASQGAAA
jgi:cyclic-di-GMP phosphodiesterase TipF (flagellum assembly factor)